ncbi:MAG: NosD domain-containing protein [Methanomassiliicoccales archaeon]
MEISRKFALSIFSVLTLSLLISAMTLSANAAQTQELSQAVSLRDDLAPERIIVNNDIELISLGYSGNGSITDPIIIKAPTGEIDARGNSSWIYIGNTTLSFKIEDWKISNCSYLGTGTIFSSGAPIILYNVTGPCIIKNCTFSFSNIGILVESSNNVSIINNTIQNCYEESIRIGNVSDCILDNNTCIASQYGISVNASFKSILTRNNCSSIYTGIIASDFMSSSILNNIINSQGQGVILERCTEVTLSDNSFLSCRIGVYLEDCSKLNIIANLIEQSMEAGIVSNSSISSIEISNNLFKGSTPIAIKLSNTDSVMIKNNTFFNPVIAISLSLSPNSLVRDNNIFASMTGIYIEKTSGHNIFNNLLQNCSKAGIEIINSTIGKIQNNKFSNVTLGIWLKEDCESIVLGNNTLGGIGKIGILMDGNLRNLQLLKNNISGSNEAGIKATLISDILLSRNYIRDCVVGIEAENGSGIILDNNTCINNKIGVRMRLCFNAQVIDNRILHNLEFGLYLNASDSISIKRNNFSANSDSGAFLSSGNKNKIENNIFYFNGHTGLNALQQKDFQIIGNIFGNNSKNGIWIRSATNATIHGNVLSGDGVGCYASEAANLQISRNEFLYCLLEGLRLETIGNAKVYDNVIRGCGGYAVNSTNSNSSRFYLNIIERNNGAGSSFDINKRQARDDSMSNIWNSEAGYGNYWSDWTSPDANRDGLVDLGYDIVGAAYDAKPLSAPIGPVKDVNYVIGETYVRLSWSAPNYTAVSQLTSYLIERKNGSETKFFELESGQTELNDSSVSALEDYLYIITAQSSIGRSVNFTIYVTTWDTSPPTVVILTPFWGSAINITSLLVKWTGSDRGTGIVKYEYSLNSGPWFSVGLNTSVNLPEMNQGWHYLSVRAWDGQGNYGINSTLFYLDSFPPLFQYIYPMGGAIFNTTTISLEWSAEDNGTGIKGYQLRLNEGEWSSVSTSNLYAIEVAAGYHEISVRAWDNVEQWNVTSIRIIVDPFAPLIEMTSPIMQIIASNQISFAWSAVENITTILFFEVRVDNGTWQNVGLNQNIILELGEGEHKFEIRAMDAAGNFGNTSKLFLVDLTAPRVQIIRPLNSTFVNEREVLIEWAVVDEASSILYYEIQLDGTIPWVNVSTSTNYRTPPLAEGMHTVSVRAWDLAGNLGEALATFIVDSIAPTLVWIAPNYGVYVNTSFLGLYWSALDDGSGLNNTHIFVDGVLWATIGLDDNYTIFNLTEGPHEIIVRVYDRAGNYRSAGVMVPIDLTPPELTIIYPSDKGVIQARDVKIDWKGEDNYSGLSRYYISLDGKNWIDLRTNTSYVARSLSEGNHVVRIRVFDNAGNSIVKSLNFTVDLTMPELRILYPSEGWTNSTSLRVRWTGSDSPLGMAYYEIRLDGMEWHNVGLNTSFFFHGLNLSVHSLEIKGVSNTSQEIIVSTILRIDLTEPGIPSLIEPTKYVNSGRISISWGHALDNESGIGTYLVKVSRTYYDGNEYVTITNPWEELGVVTTYVSFGNPDGWYNISVRARDRAGNLGKPVTTQIVLDTEPPRAIGYNPLGQSVSVNPSIIVIFSEPMLKASVSLEMGAVGLLAWESDTTLRYILTSNLSYDRTYTITINGRDLAGNSMSSLIWQFTTIPNIGWVVGKVVDERGFPIQGVMVSIETGQTEVTNRLGEFTIAAPSGVHTLTIRYEGYNELRLNVTVTAGEAIDLGMTRLTRSTNDFNWVIILAFALLIAVSIEMVYLRKRRKNQG